MAIKHWMSWEGGVDLVAMMDPSLSQPNVIVHLARMVHRRAFLMEIDPAYCDVIVQRWEKFTGRKAERIAGEVVAEAQEQVE